MCPETTIPDVNQHHNAPVHLDSLRNRASLCNTGQANSSRHIVVIHAHGNTDDVTTQCRDARSEVVNYKHLVLNYEHGPCKINIPLSKLAQGDFTISSGGSRNC